MDTKWIKRYFAMSQVVSSWSKDPSTKVGAVIIGEKGQIISQGYNGFPRGVKDTPERYNDRPLKYQLVVHAEMNAILNALYNGSSVKDCTMFVHNLPICVECAKAIIQAGIKEVYLDTPVPDRWKKSWELTKLLFSEAQVKFHFVQDCDIIEEKEM
jgi:dCMP deaminase